MSEKIRKKERTGEERGGRRRRGCYMQNLGGTRLTGTGQKCLEEPNNTMYRLQGQYRKVGQMKGKTQGITKITLRTDIKFKDVKSNLGP